MTLFTDCSDNPCQNDGVCVAANTTALVQYQCSCPPGFTGPNCDKNSEPPHSHYFLEVVVKTTWVWNSQLSLTLGIYMYVPMMRWKIPFRYMYVPTVRWKIPFRYMYIPTVRWKIPFRQDP